MVSIGSTAQISSCEVATEVPRGDRLRTGGTVMNSAASQRNQMNWQQQGCQGNGEPGILHALHVMATVIFDLHRNEFTNDY